MDNLGKILFTKCLLLLTSFQNLLRLNVVFMVRKIGHLLLKWGGGGGGVVVFIPHHPTFV